MATPSGLTNRIEVPPTGRAVTFLVFVAIVGFFTWVAVYLVLNAHALTKWEVGASLFWLALVVFWIIAPIVEAGGLYACFINLVGIFARCGIIEIQSNSNGVSELRYGFRCCGLEFFFTPIDIRRIRMVNWHHGQASDVSGRDCKDWSVAVWSTKSGDVSEWDSIARKDKDIRIVTPNLPKEVADHIGRSIVALFQDAGVPLVASGNKSGFDGEFTVNTPDP